MQLDKIQKKSGGYRQIVKCSREERDRLREHLPALDAIQRRDCPHAHGFAAGRSTVTAARLHRGYRYTLCCDLRDFFDRCTRDAAERAGVPAEILDACLYEDRAAQGLPTSPAIANICAARIDAEIVTRLADLDPDATYTRYADDLSISSDSREVLDTLRGDLPCLVARHGHEIHPRKWSLQDSRYGHRVVCGVVIGEETLTATRKQRRRLRAAQHRVDRGKGDSRTANLVRGLSEWCEMRRPVLDVMRERCGGREPDQHLLDALELYSRDQRWSLRHTVEAFPTRDYIRAYKYLEAAVDKGGQNQAERTQWAVKLACTFGANWRQWLDGCAKRGCSIHDATHWLPTRITPDDGLGRRLTAWLKSSPDLLDRLGELAILGKHWHRLDAQQRRLPLAKLLDYARSAVYVGAKHAEFAAECASHGVSEDEYYGLEARWLKGINVKYETIPRGELARIGDYRAVILSRDDPRALWAGQHTDCCQHPDGEGKTCAWHAATNRQGAILAVFRGDKIVAQSWLWRVGAVVVADNIESLGGHGTHLPDLYRQAAKSLVGRLCIEWVQVGAGNNDCDVSRFPLAEKVQPPKGCYTDAHNQRRIV